MRTHISRQAQFSPAPYQPYRCSKARIAQVLEAAKDFTTALANYNDCNTTWLANHWTGVPSFRAPYGRPVRNSRSARYAKAVEQDTTNTRNVYAATDDLYSAWAMLKTTMARAVQSRSFGKAHVKLRPRRNPTQKKTAP